MLAFALALLAIPSAALGAEYEVDLCTPNGKATDGLVFESSRPAGEGPLFVEGCDEKLPGVIKQGKKEDPTGTSENNWRVQAPENTSITSFSVSLGFAHGVSGQPSFVEWSLASSERVLMEVRDDGRMGGSLPAEKRFTFPSKVQVTQIAGILNCFKECFGKDFTVTSKKLVATLEDFKFPVVFAPTMAANVRGVTNVSYSASDGGSGVASAALVIDGVEQAVVPDTFGGRCVKPYHFVTPCRLAVQTSLPLDTTGLSEGRHEAAVAVVDAAGQRTVSPAVVFNVHNAPINSAGPAIAGSTLLGGTLVAGTGAWLGNPTSFAYQWARCPAAVTSFENAGSCVPVPGATGARYTTTAADVGKRMIALITATNAKGSEAALSNPSDVVSVPVLTGDHTPPKVSHVTLTSKRLLAAHLPTSVGGKTRLAFSSSEDGDLTILIDKVKGGKAVKRIIKLGAAIKEGRSVVPLAATVGNKALSPGNYMVTISVRDKAKNSSKPARIQFRVVPR